MRGQESKNIVGRGGEGISLAMTPRRLHEIASLYGKLKIALVGDICLDRYFEIDPGLQEVSIETNLPVHNVARVRCQPGGAGTILNNLAALKVGEIIPAAIIGRDGEGFELRRALERVAEVQAVRIRTDWIVESAERHTFTYSKPLLMHKNSAPEELSRLDTKNWTPTPEGLQERMIEAVRELGGKSGSNVDAIILLDQVDIPETGVVTRKVLEVVREVAARNPNLLVMADSRRSLRGFPKVSFKMNAAELGLFFDAREPGSMKDVKQVKEKALALSNDNSQHVFITMAERGMVGAHRGEVQWVPALPVRGEIDIVGAGDAVTANLVAALSAGATLKEALELAQLAASVVIHQLGTTGTATAEEMETLL